MTASPTDRLSASPGEVARTMTEAKGRWVK